MVFVVVILLNLMCSVAWSDSNAIFDANSEVKVLKNKDIVKKHHKEEKKNQNFTNQKLKSKNSNNIDEKNKQTKRYMKYGKLKFGATSVTLEDVELVSIICEGSIKTLVFMNEMEVAEKVNIQNNEKCEPEFEDKNILANDVKLILLDKELIKKSGLWIVSSNYITINSSDIQMNDFAIENENGAIVSVKQLNFAYLLNKKTVDVANDDYVCRIEQLYIAPTNDITTWGISSECVRANKKQALFSGNKFIIGNAKIALPNIHFDQNPSSGFLIPGFRKDRLDGFIFSLPYYFFLDDNSDAIISPHGGSTFGVDIKYRRKASNTIFFINSTIKYLTIENFRKGGYFHVRSYDTTETKFDCDLILASSKQYLQYGDNKENKLNRESIPWHFYFLPHENIRVGIFGALAVDGKNKGANVIIPKVSFNKRLQKDWGIVSVASCTEFFSYVHQRNVENDMANAAKSVLCVSVEPEPFFSKIFTSSFEIGEKFTIDSFSYRTKPFVIQRTRFASFRNSNVVVTPYFDYKLAKTIKLAKIDQDEQLNVLYDLTKYSLFSHNRVGSNNLYEKNFKESVGSYSSDSACMGGLSFDFRNNLALKTGVFKDKYGTYLDLEGNYFYKQFFMKANGYVNVSNRNQSDDNFVLSIGIRGTDKIVLKYSHINHNRIVHKKLSNIWQVRLNDNWGLEFDGIYTLAPVSNLMEGGVKVTYTNVAWQFGFGMSYGNDILRNEEDKTFRFTFSISLNGARQFITLAKHLKSMDFKELTDMQGVRR